MKNKIILSGIFVVCFLVLTVANFTFFSNQKGNINSNFTLKALACGGDAGENGTTWAGRALDDMGEVASDVINAIGEAAFGYPGGTTSTATPMKVTDANGNESTIMITSSAPVDLCGGQNAVPCAAAMASIAAAIVIYEKVF